MVALMDDPEIDLAGLMEVHRRGPDFPTGGIIMGRGGIRALLTPRAAAKSRWGPCRDNPEKKERALRDHNSEIPTWSTRPALIESIAALVPDKRMEGHQRPER